MRSPIVVQADHTVLLEVQHPGFEDARARLSRFAELTKSPEYVHSYRITPISVWHAAALGEPVEEITGWLQEASNYPVAPAVLDAIREWHRRYGLLRFEASGQPDALHLVARDAETLAELRESKLVGTFLSDDGTPDRAVFATEHRGVLKHVLIKLGYPVQDQAGYRSGARLELALSERAGAFELRDYQRRAAETFWADGTAAGGCGVIVLPCGSGKTVVGMAVMQLSRTNTLILTTNTVAVRQWRRELRDKTSLRDEDIGEYTGDRKDVRPVTIATYQILTYRRRRSDPFVHFELFERSDWGLIVYDEVHLLPAPVFRATAAIQARRRLGLTATLVREDGKEGDVFSLIGPKRFELPWRELERDGYLASARCLEVRTPLTATRAQQYRAAGARARMKIASANEGKLDVLGGLLRRHRDDRVLVIGQYLDQLRSIATTFELELITGKTPMREREVLFERFRSGEIQRLLVSKVGNFAIDLPDANVAIQVSGSFGSRQEEAQRLGRILRPKQNHAGAVFYSLVSEGTCEVDFSARRQLFLTEQGYGYEIVGAAELQQSRQRP